jgi:hypothetical protein
MIIGWSMPDTSTNPGGVGGRRANLQNLALVRRALRCGFKVPRNLKDEAVKQIGAILADQNAPARSKIAATRALTTMESVTISSIDTALRAQAAEEFDERLKELEAWQGGYSEVSRHEGGEK